MTCPDKLADHSVDVSELSRYGRNARDENGRKGRKGVKVVKVVSYTDRPLVPGLSTSVAVGLSTKNLPASVCADAGRSIRSAGGP